MESPASQLPFSATALVLSLFAVLYIRHLVDWKVRTKGLPLPPGPRDLPVIGNILDVPNSKPWVWYKQLSDKYGDIAHFTVLGQSFVVLGSVDAIIECLEKHASDTSDRQSSPMIELSGNSGNIGVMSYGPRWRRYRRAFWQHFNRDSAIAHQPIQRANTHRFLEQLLDDPLQLENHLHSALASLVLRVAYGLEVDEGYNMYKTAAETAVEGLVQGLVPGKFLVEFVPILRYIPTWFPGAASQRLFSKWQNAARIITEMPYEAMKASFEQPQVSGSVVGQLYEKLSTSSNQHEDDEVMIKDIGAGIYETAADTILASMEFFFLAMSLYPEVARKAQAELDDVVGPDRMPDFDDLDALVYVNAILLENLRWQTIGPVAVPHTTTADLEFRGYFVPAGTVVVPNVWACMHDAEVYKDPENFRPERFIRDGRLNPDVRSPASFVFGFGRRICPGRYFALAGLMINMASVLHVFNITPPLNETGEPIEIAPVMADGLISHPEDYRCTIKPRSSRAEALILEYARLARTDVGGA